MVRDIFFFILKNSSTWKIIGIEKKDYVSRKWVRNELFALKYWEENGERLALCNAVILFLELFDIKLQVFRVVWVFHSCVHTHARHQIICENVHSKYHNWPISLTISLKIIRVLYFKLEPHIVLHLLILLLRLYMWIFVIIYIMCMNKVIKIKINLKLLSIL